MDPAPAKKQNGCLWWTKIILAVILPPAAVALEVVPAFGCTTPSLVLILLAFVATLFGWIPGIVFALFIVLSVQTRNKLMAMFDKSKTKPEQAKPAAGQMEVTTV